MRLVITGGSGSLGRQVVADAIEHGHDVLSLDRVALPEQPCTCWIADLTRVGDLYQAMHGADGVVHLAAYQAPGLVPDTETFANNITATYNVLKAATDLGVKRIVLASSVAAYGFIYAPKMDMPRYLPLDEQHPCAPRDPYGLSKVFGEQLADSFAAIGGATIASLRFPGINFDLSYERLRARMEDPGQRLGNFWSYIDVRDASAACLAALGAGFSGHEVFNLAAPTSSMRAPTAQLIDRFLPGVPIREGFEGNFAGLDSSKAARLLGFHVQHHWQDYLPDLALGD